MKYIITWIAYVTTTMSCPDARNSDNTPYGKISCSSIHLMVEQVRRQQVVTGWSNAVKFADSLKNIKPNDYYMEVDSVILKPYTIK